MSMGIVPPRPLALCINKGDRLINDSLKERGPILLDIPDGQNEVVMAAHFSLSIPKLWPIIGLCKELPGIALPQPIPLELPKPSLSRKVKSNILYQKWLENQALIWEQFRV